MINFWIVLAMVIAMGCVGIYSLNFAGQTDEDAESNAKEAAQWMQVRSLAATLAQQGFSVETGRRLPAKADAEQWSLQLLCTDHPCDNCDGAWRVEWCEYFLVSDFGVCTRNRIALVCPKCGHVDRFERVVTIGVFGHLLVHDSNVFGILKPGENSQSGAQKMRDIIARTSSRISVLQGPGSDSGWTEPGEN